MQFDGVNEDEDEPVTDNSDPEASNVGTVEAPVAVQEEPIKACCICGLDVSQKQRARDQAGRHWCAPCSEFAIGAGKTNGMTQCPDCGRDTRPMLMVDQGGEKVCTLCNKDFLNEIENRRLHRIAATANPELEIRQLIREMLRAIAGAVVLAGVLTLYHFGLLYVHPKAWVPFQSALCFFGAMAVGVGIAIAVQYIRMSIRKRERRAEYDKMVQAAANHVLALDEDSHTMGISESPEPLRRRVERAIARIEACAGLGIGGAGDIVASFAKKTDPATLIEFLQSQRPSTTDTVARNREIATISYLHVDLETATSALTAILLRLPFDQDAMTRHALICFRTGKLEQAKKIFKRVVHIAREKNSEVDLAAAYCNLGMLHVMLAEFDDASVRYSQAMIIYTKLNREDGQADCFLNLGLIAYRQKKLLEVEDQLRKAMAINRRRKRREGLSICCSILGVILVEKEVPQLKEAEKLLNQAIRLNLELGRPGGVAAAYGNLGLARVKRRDLAGATELFLKAQSIYQRINRPKMTAKIQGMLKTVGTLSAAKAASSRSGK